MRSFRGICVAVSSVVLTQSLVAAFTSPLSGVKSCIRSQASQISVCSRASSALHLKNGDGADEKTSTETDWDDQLRKLNAKQIKGVSETEVKLSKFQRKVKNTVNKAKLDIAVKLDQRQPIALPGPNKLKKQLATQAQDWKFWAAILAVVAFAAALNGALSREELVVLDGAASSAQYAGLLAYSSEAVRSLGGEGDGFAQAGQTMFNA